MYASASSDEDEEEDSAAAAAGAASGSGIDAQYAAALEAAAAGGATAEEAAAAPGAPSADALVAAQEAEAAGAKAALRQPSLWNAFEGGRRMLQVGAGLVFALIGACCCGGGCGTVGLMRTSHCSLSQLASSLLCSAPVTTHNRPCPTCCSTAHGPAHPAARSNDSLPPAAQPSAPARPMQRYVGQCNLQTDIKECCFLGCNDELVAAGSDDGRVFIFRTATGECIR